MDPSLAHSEARAQLRVPLVAGPRGTGTVNCQESWGIATVDGLDRWSRLDPAPAQTPEQSWGVWDLHAASLGDLHSEITPPNGSIPYFGFPIGLCRLYHPCAGDFLPVGQTLGASTECLVPPGMAGASTGWQGLTRPTVDGVVDLATGLPMIRVVDLELPFDGATFRLVRTRTEDTGCREQVGAFGLDSESVEKDLDRWWDWTGTGWMVGENPLLLIDSSLASVVGDGPPTCYLILDAHHSIPFQQVRHRLGGDEEAVTYMAPPRFRARLEHFGGDWDTVTDPAGGTSRKGWVTPPTTYKVSLYDGALTYTFAAVRTDMPKHKWFAPYLFNNSPIDRPVSPDAFADPSWREASYHERPLLPQLLGNGQPGTHFFGHSPYDSSTNPGLGIPHYGLCTRINDRYGHEVAIEYARSRTRSMDDPTTPECEECQHDGLARGQIQSIKLKSGGVVRWTLLYAHRRFVGPMAFDRYDLIRSVPPGGVGGDAARYELYGFNAIERIYVFEHDVDSAALAAADLTTHFNQPVDLNHDPIAAWNTANGTHVLPTDWKYQVQYKYATYVDSGQGGLTALGKPAPGRTNSSSCWYQPQAGHAASPPTLTMTTTITRDERALAERRSRRVYTYWMNLGWALWGFVGPEDGFRSQPTLVLRSVYDEADITAAQNSVVDGAVPTSADALAAQRTLAGTADLNTDEAKKLDKYASIRLHSPELGLTRWPEEADDWTEPDLSALYAQSTPGAPYMLVESGSLARTLHERFVKSASIRGADGRVRHYRISRFLANVPETDAANAQAPEAQASSVVVPYRWLGFWNPTAGAMEGIERNAPDLAKARWIALIDEVEDAVTARQTAYLGAFIDKLWSRRVVEINAAGVVLRERSWEFEGGGATLVGGSGLGEEFRYEKASAYFAARGHALPVVPDSATDGSQLGGQPGSIVLNEEDPAASIRDELLLVERRSVGWSVNAMDETVHKQSGLIQFFEHDWETVADGSSGEPRLQIFVVQTGEGIRKGTEGEKLYTRSFIRDEDVPTDIVCDIEYVEPTTAEQLITTPPDIAQSLPVEYVRAKITHHVTERVEDPALPAHEQRVKSRTMVGPPRRLRPGGAWYFPVTREQSDQTGATVWSASGLMQNPLAPSGSGDPFESLSITRYFKDEHGRAIGTVLDAGEGQHTFAGALAATTWSSSDPPMEGWAKLPADQPALNYITEFMYDGDGLSDTIFPNGRRWARRVVAQNVGSDQDPDYRAREFILNDLAPARDGTTGEVILHTWLVHSISEIKYYNGPKAVGTPAKTERVTFSGQITDAQFTTAGVESLLEQREVEAEVRFTLDFTGRPVQANMAETITDIVGLAEAGSKLINDLVDYYRELDTSGQITTQTRDTMGRVLRTYTGTQDQAWRDMRPGQPIDPATFNMVMTERVEYGAGVNDAWLPRVTFRYRARPGDSTGDWSLDYYGLPPAHDVDAYATVTGYDWRMRPVRVDAYDKGDYTAATPPQVLSTTLTYLDHANRPRLVVTYGRGGCPTLPPGLDPTLAPIAAEVPRAAKFFEQTPHPASISETIYGPDGSVTLRRTYDMAWTYSATGNPPFTAELQCTGLGGQQVYSQRPGEASRVTRLDGVGRVVSTSTIVPGRVVEGAEFELTRSENTCDADGNVVETAVWDRMVDDNVAVLSAANAVRSRTVSWYDVKKRLIATADLGTENNAGFVNATGTAYQRDENLRPTFTTSPGGTAVVSRAGLPSFALLRAMEYDTAGRLWRTLEPDGSVVEMTYSGMGRMLTRTENRYNTSPGGAPEHLRRTTTYTYENGRMVSMESPRKNANERPQRTWLHHTAAVVDDEFNIVSQSKTMVGTVRMPDTPVPAFAIRYNMAGSIAERIDRRGVAFRYRYDGDERLASIEIGHYPPPTTDALDYPPANTVFTPGYPASMSAATGAVADRVGFVEYGYDFAGRLNRVTAWTGVAGAIIAQNVFDNDLRGHLIREWQQIGGWATFDTPRIDYWWDYQPTTLTTEGQVVSSGRDRLSGMTYPKHSQVSTALAHKRRQVDIEYGAPGSTEDLTSRITDIDTFLPNSAPTSVADFARTGSGRRASVGLANNRILASFAAAGVIGLSGLDTFGRVADLRYSGAGGATLHRAVYTHDAAGNRLTARVTQVAAPGIGDGNNRRSQAHGYDQLNRLIESNVGVLDNGAIGTQDRVRSDRWHLDLLGNWIGTGMGDDPSAYPTQASLFGRRSTGELDGYGTPWLAAGGAAGVDAQHETLHFTPFTDHGNQLAEFLRWRDDGGESPSPDPLPAPSRTHTLRDAAGNLVFDGTYVYQYDAWNRVVQ
ncbi:MAG: hypothetical protein IT438_11100, partial [Phycisphaerales bacterium]|nr:hypothetical protein [Phycisphaerales bacterium]